MPKEKGTIRVGPLTDGLTPKAKIPPANAEGESVLTEGLTPRAEIPPAPPSQPQSPAPESSKEGDKK